MSTPGAPPPGACTREPPGPARLRPPTARLLHGYHPALDGLRGIAVVMVLAFHGGLPLAGGGFVGVDVFFVLSGYLITSLLWAEWARTGAVSLRRFYLRRALRLLPALMLLLAALAVYGAVWMPPHHITWLRAEMIATALYVMNWAQALGRIRPLGMLAHAWSLAIEGQFYVVWPVVLLAALRLGARRRTLLGLVLAGIAASAGVRALIAMRDGAGPRLFFGTDTRADALLMGCALGLLLSWGALPSTRRFHRWLPPLALAAVAGMAIMVVQATPSAAWMSLGGFTLVAALAALVILDVMAAPDGLLARLLSVPFLVAIGRISYGVYLWHWPIFLLVRPETIDQSASTVAALRLALTFAIAALSYLCVEQPFLRLKRAIGRPPAVLPSTKNALTAASRPV